MQNSQNFLTAQEMTADMHKKLPTNFLLGQHVGLICWLTNMPLWTTYYTSYPSMCDDWHHLVYERWLQFANFSRYEYATMQGYR